MTEQRSGDLLLEADTLDLQGIEDPQDRLVLMMDWMVQHARIEALGWWEHTADWDLESQITTTDGQELEFEGSPGYHLVINGTKYEPWDLIKDPTTVPIHTVNGIQSVMVHITDFWVYEDTDQYAEGHEASVAYDLSRIATISHGRV